MRVVVAAAATTLAIFLVTGGLYGFSAWREWWFRIQALNADLATNEVTLRMLLAGVDSDGGHAYAGTLAAVRAGSGWGRPAGRAGVARPPARGRHAARAPSELVLLNPANYHVHFIFLLVLLGAGRNLLAAAAPLLVFASPGYWVDLDPDSPRHFES